MQEQERVRLCDIAEELGLSTATVSNVIHGKTKKVSEETIQRVQALLEQRQYIPSMASILLAQNDSKIFGIVINDHEKYEGHVLEDGFISASVNALSREADAAGYFLMIKATPHWEEIPKYASMWNMAGLVLIGFCDQDYQKLRDAIRVPFVIYDGFLDGGKRLVNLTVDNFEGGRKMGEYFRTLGHEKVLFLADNDTHVDHDRYLGLQSVYPEAAILIVPMEKRVRQAFYQKVKGCLCRFTAIFAASDYYAVDLMYFLQSQGISVPGEIAVAGFDDSILSRQVHPSLTTVGHDHTQRARLAIRLLGKLRAQETIEPEYRLPVTLVERESTRSKKEK